MGHFALGPILLGAPGATLSRDRNTLLERSLNHQKGTQWIIILHAEIVPTFNLRRSNPQTFPWASPQTPHINKIHKIKSAH